MFSKKNENKMCPLLKKPCIGNECMWAYRIAGTDPTTGDSIDEESCAIAWLPLLLTENVKASNSTGAAVESFRNEMVTLNNNPIANLLLGGVK